MGKISKSAGPSNAGADVVVDEPPAPVAEAPEFDDPPETDDAPAEVGQVEEEEAPEASDSAGSTTPTGDDDATEAAPPPDRRPPVNASKGDHLDYGVTRYGLDRVYLDDEFNKADLVAKLTALDDDKAHIVDGRIIDGPAEADPRGEGDANDAAADVETDDSDQDAGDTADAD